MPSSEEATMVTWEELEQAITDGWKGSQTVNNGGGPGGGQPWKGPLNLTVLSFLSMTTAAAVTSSHRLASYI